MQTLRKTFGQRTTNIETDMRSLLNSSYTIYNLMLKVNSGCFGYMNLETKLFML